MFASTAFNNCTNIFAFCKNDVFNITGSLCFQASELGWFGKRMRERRMCFSEVQQLRSNEYTLMSLLKTLTRIIQTKKDPRTGTALNLWTKFPMNHLKIERKGDMLESWAFSHTVPSQKIEGNRETAIVKIRIGIDMTIHKDCEVSSEWSTKKLSSDLASCLWSVHCVYISSEVISDVAPKTYEKWVWIIRTTSETVKRDLKRRYFAWV